jgi:hypothetical protein
VSLFSRLPYPCLAPADKFNASGTVRPFAGNTVLCHLDQQGENATAFHALLDIYREAQAHAFVRRMTLLPPSSYHMTVFGGVNDQGRSKAWPPDLPIDLSIEECSDIIAERLRASGPYPMEPICMRVDRAAAHKDEEHVLRIRLLPLDRNEEGKLHELRDRLARVFGFRRADHDCYVFHISLAYLIAAPTAVESADLRDCASRWREMLERRCPQISLGAPEYCTFKDMYAFHRVTYLA